MDNRNGSDGFLAQYEYGFLFVIEGFPPMRPDRDAGKLGGAVAAGAIFAAPFIALLYRAEAGLVVMAIALGAVSLVLHGAVDAAPPHARQRLRLVLMFNVVLIVSCLALAAWLIERS